MNLQWLLTVALNWPSSVAQYNYVITKTARKIDIIYLYYNQHTAKSFVIVITQSIQLEILTFVIIFVIQFLRASLISVSNCAQHDVYHISQCKITNYGGFIYNISIKLS